MKHLFLYLLVTSSFSTSAQRDDIYRPVQNETPPVQIYFGHIKSTHTTVEELVKVDSVIVFQPDIIDQYLILSCQIFILDKNGKTKSGALNYVDHFDENIKSKFKRLKPGDTVSVFATVKSYAGRAMKMGNSVQIE